MDFQSVRKKTERKSILRFEKPHFTSGQLLTSTFLAILKLKAIEMPLYVYEIIREGSNNVADDSASDGEQFEVLQGLNDPPLTHHPDCGSPVRRIIAAPSMAGRWTDMKAATSLSDKNLGAKGFTKYVKVRDGKYEKSAGKGPKTFSTDK